MIKPINLSSQLLRLNLLKSISVILGSASNDSYHKPHSSCSIILQLVEPLTNCNSLNGRIVPVTGFPGSESQLLSDFGTCCLIFYSIHCFHLHLDPFTCWWLSVVRMGKWSESWTQFCQVDHLHFLSWIVPQFHSFLLVSSPDPYT